MHMSIDIFTMTVEIRIYKMFLILLHWVLNLNLYCSCIFSLGLTWLGGAVIGPPDHQMCLASIWLQPRSKINSILDFRQIFFIFDTLKYVCPHFTLHIHFSFIVWETVTSVPAYSLQSTAQDDVIKARQGQEAEEINKWGSHLRSLSVLRCLFVWKPITSTGDNSNKQQRQSLWRCDGNTQHIPRVLRWMIDIAAVKQTRNSITLLWN